MNLDAERIELENMLSSSDAAIVFFAVRNLRKFSPDKVAPALMAFLNNPARVNLREHRIEAVKMLSEIHDPRLKLAMPSMITSESDPYVQATLISSCSHIFGKNDNLRDTLTRLLEHSDPRVVANAIEALGHFDSETVRSLLKKYLFSSVPRQSMNAAVAFYKAGEEKIYSFIKLKLTGENPTWQASAAYAIGQVNDSQSSGDLLKVLPSACSEVRGITLRSLAGIADPGLIMPIISCMLVEKETNLQDTYIQTLKTIDEDQAVAKLSEISANSGNPRIQATAMKLLGNFNSPGTLETVKKGLVSSDPRVTANSIEALMNQGSESSSMLLREYLSSSNSRIRGNAVMAMWKLGITGVIKHLREMMEFGDPNDRSSAAWVIDRLGIDYLFTAA